MRLSLRSEFVTSGDKISGIVLQSERSHMLRRRRWSKYSCQICCKYRRFFSYNNLSK